MEITNIFDDNVEFMAVKKISTAHENSMNRLELFENLLELEITLDGNNFEYVNFSEKFLNSIKSFNLQINSQKELNLEILNSIFNMYKFPNLENYELYFNFQYSDIYFSLDIPKHVKNFKMYLNCPSMFYIHIDLCNNIALQDIYMTGKENSNLAIVEVSKISKNSNPFLKSFYFNSRSCELPNCNFNYVESIYIKNEIKTEINIKNFKNIKDLHLENLEIL